MPFYKYTHKTQSGCKYYFCFPFHLICIYRHQNYIYQFHYQNAYRNVRFVLFFTIYYYLPSTIHHTLQPLHLDRVSKLHTFSSNTSARSSSSPSLPDLSSALFRLSSIMTVTSSTSFWVCSRRLFPFSCPDNRGITWLLYYIK